MNIGIIGCGLIGRKRAAALRGGGDRLCVACDIDGEAARALGAEYGCATERDWKRALAHPGLDAVVVATVNNLLEPITLAALEAGLHVLCEKPLGRNRAEAQRMTEAARRRHRVLKTGFNHRFHPGLLQARHILAEGGIGDPFIIRARYGHGGRPGMEREWRCSRELCGGGELLDQGVHVIDLIRCFGGEITRVEGATLTAFWNIDVEDNAFALFRTDRGVTAQMHVSWTNWRNVFSFEVFGRSGYLAVNGLGGSYGPETLEWGRRRPEGGRPDIETFTYPAEDGSWAEEWKEFRAAVAEGREADGSGEDGVQANRVIEELYAAARG
jgi:predicted dehydrogenase